MLLILAKPRKSAKWTERHYRDPKNFHIGETIAVIKDKFKYIYHLKQDKGELYNFEKDPKELINLAEVEKKRAIEMKNIIFEKIIKQRWQWIKEIL